MGEEESPGLFPLTESSLWCGEWKPLSLPVVERDTRPLTVLNLPVHVQNALERADILTVGFLVQCSKLFFTDGNVSGIGPKSLRDIRSCLAAIGLKLKGD